MLFLTDVDHVSFEKANGTRQNNLQAATVSIQLQPQFDNANTKDRNYKKGAKGERPCPE